MRIVSYGAVLGYCAQSTDTNDRMKRTRHNSGIAVYRCMCQNSPVRRGMTNHL